MKAPAGVDMALVTGSGDALLRLIQESFASRITVRGDEVTFTGDAEEAKSLTLLFSDIFKHIAHLYFRL